MNFGFLDIEMTCDGNQKNGKFIDDGRMKRSHREIISVGFIVCDDKYNIKKSYSSFVKPVHNAILTDYCKNLTGIKQEDVDYGKKCNNAFRDILEICKQYSVRYIFTFGNMDKMGIIFSAKWNKKAKQSVYNLYAVANKIIDIRMTVLNEIAGKSKRKSPSLFKIAETLKIEIKDEHHNALNDTILLCKICKELNIKIGEENNTTIVEHVNSDDGGRNNIECLDNGCQITHDCCNGDQSKQTEKVKFK